MENGNLSPMFGKHHSEETKRKIGMANKGRKHTEEEKIKMRGRVSLMKGKKRPPFSKEWRKKMSLVQLGKKHKATTLGKHWKYPHSFTEEHKELLGKAMKGNKNAWKGGLTPERNKIRGCLEYKLWEDSIKIIDKYYCKKCGENRINKLTVHHIQNFSSYPELRFAINNGITFCRDCHKKFHHKYGKKNNTKEQIEKFLI